MSLNDVQLPPALIADLYKNNLIETGTIPETTAPVIVQNEPGESMDPIAIGWKWLGNNKKNILAIVRSADAAHLPDNELELLTAMMTACKLGLDDIAILNLNNHPEASYKELINFFKSKIVLLFETEPTALGLPMSFPYFQLQAFAGNTFLYSPSLTELANDKVLKSKLWVCLKRLFNL
ncbi:MAG: hypothetical protein HZB42_04455 [Sphingobacteriales bacterium]|nr:hypothetical protein [Sphingobacteriales bacterium]